MITKRQESKWTSPFAFALYIALVKLAIHLLTANRYGYFRDELYYIACGEHLAWGYVDHAPMVAWLIKLSRTFEPMLRCPPTWLPLTTGVPSAVPMNGSPAANRSG